MRKLIRIPAPYVKVGNEESSLKTIFDNHFKENIPLFQNPNEVSETYIDHNTIMCNFKIEKNEFDEEFIPYLESMGYIEIGKTNKQGYQLYHKPNSKKVPFIHYRTKIVSDESNITSVSIDSLTLKHIRELGLEKDIIDLYKTFNRLIINLSHIEYFRRFSLKPITVLNQRRVIQRDSSSFRR